MWTCPHYSPNIKLLAIFAQQKVRLATHENKKINIGKIYIAIAIGDQYKKIE